MELATVFGHLVARNFEILPISTGTVVLVTNCTNENLTQGFGEFPALLNNPQVNIHHFVAFIQSALVNTTRVKQDQYLLLRWCFINCELIRNLTGGQTHFEVVKQFLED
ncbi:hypothetical protein MJO28_012084 [Puccinia striiformis f. sp. tritici]|nr:hypothetical protein MJO28_012084 [Puccinia striiformis f. sp. tritici]KAI7945961.1 hypothetical protein MJO29_012349 [Puccinia striiformis f. sp. tritici]